MPLKVVKRRSTGAWTISGTVAGIRIQKRASTNNRRLAEEEATALEARLLREQWHGPKPGSRTIGEAMLSYADAVPRSRQTRRRLARLVDAIGENTPLSAIDQDALSRVRAKLQPAASPASFARDIAGPFRAVLRYAAKQGWCAEPHFELPRPPQGRTLFLLPAQAGRLIDAAAEHLQPLLIFLLGTGARVSEALELEWADVDLVGERALLWKTKSGQRRIASLPPRVIAALASLPEREGAVFRNTRGPYPVSDRSSGGQLRRPWIAALQQADLDPKFTPHCLRHTWASWHYALHKDLLALKVEGGWGSVTMVERYAKLLPAGHEATIREFLGFDRDHVVTEAA